MIVFFINSIRIVFFFYLQDFISATIDKSGDVTLDFHVPLGVYGWKFKKAHIKERSLTVTFEGVNALEYHRALN